MNLVMVIFVELLDQFRITLPVSWGLSLSRSSSLDNALGIPRTPLSEHRLPGAGHLGQSLYAFRRISIMSRIPRVWRIVIHELLLVLYAFSWLLDCGWRAAYLAWDNAQSCHQPTPASITRQYSRNTTFSTITSVIYSWTWIGRVHTSVKLLD